MYPMATPSQPRTAAAPEPEPIALAAPPRLAESPPMAGSAAMILMPVASGLGAVLLAVTHQDRPLYAVAGLAVLAASIAAGLGMIVSSRTGARRRTREQRERYLDHLEQARLRARAAATRQLNVAATRHPDPSAAASMAWLPSRRWVRGRNDPDFLVLRAALGPAPLVGAPTLRVDDSDPLAGYDQVCLTAAEELAARYACLAVQPICVSLAAATALAVVGEPARAVSVTRALLAQLIWAHSPADVAVLVCGGGSENWDWLKWLPHTRADQGRDGPLPSRLITDRAGPGAAELLTAQARGSGPTGVNPGRRTVVVIDGLSGWTGDLSALAGLAKAVGAVALCLMPPDSQPTGVDLRVLLGDAGDCVESASGALRCRLDELDAADALLLARSFAGLPAGLPQTHPGEPAAVDPLRLGDVATLDPAVSWRPRPDGELLRVPIGTAQDGGPLMLDLKESARGGMGPHGLVVGATGSGKSELLRSLVTALAIAHPPGTLALLLADFKGGATFSGLAELPHVAGTITNLEADLSLVDRFRDALGGELQRRQEVLAASGKLTSQRAYADLRRRRPDLEPMPHLLVVVDEFSELLGARPDLAELFVTIGRIGRSIGIHLLLATQRLDIGRIRGLESHLSYRICLRTFSEAESREAIGSPDAYLLPPDPGSAFLRADNAGLRRFRSATMSVPYRSPASAPGPVDPLVLPFGPGLAGRIWELRRRSSTASSRGAGLRDRRVEQREPTVLDIAIERVRVGGRELPAGRPARRVWLDPLPARLTVADVLGRKDCQRGPDSAMAVLGLVDIPERQRQDALCWDFTEGNGNLLIVGAGRSGKTTAVRTLLLSLAARHPPSEMQLVCVDLAGETLRPFGALPQVAAVATRDDAELTRRVFSRLTDLLAEREAPGGRHRVGSAAIPIVLIIDGWVSGGDSDAVLDEILRRGPAAGLHTVLTVNAPSDLRARLAAGFGGRIELRLADPFDSSIDRQMAKTLPANIPGRALVAGRHFAQVALPDLRPAVPHRGSALATQHAGRSDERDAIGHAVATVRGRWPGPSAPLIRTLPSMVRLDDLQAAARGRRRIQPGLLLGIAEEDLGPVHHDLLGDDPHLLIYGDARAGKTTVLRSLIAQLSAGPGSAGSPNRVLIVDYRRGLNTDAVSGGHRLAIGAAESGTMCTALVAELAGRMRPADGPPDRSEQRIYLLVDDYDLLGTGTGNPLHGLLPYLAHGRDVGFHLIVARRTGGAAHAQYEPLLQTLGDLGTPVLLLSGSPAEGRLAHGLTPRPLPPGRALIATRDTAPQVIQTLWVP